MAATRGVDITAQGLDARFTDRAAQCLRAVLEQAVQYMVSSEPLAIPILQRFTAVHVLDSTVLKLPPALIAEWAGCGANEPNAALKVQARLDVLHGGLALSLQAGRTSDRKSPYQDELPPRGALRLSDLGFFDLHTFARLAQHGAYWLTRVQARTGWYSAMGEPLDLVSALSRQSAASIEWPVQLGAGQRVAARMLAWRVSAAVTRQRRRHLREEARRRRQPLSDERMQLAGWDIYVTNAPAELVRLSEAPTLVRVRWQIELLFKLWKAHGELDESVSQNPWRLLCEVYAKLLGQLVQYWLLLVSQWAAPDHSWWKAARIIRHYALALAAVFGATDQLETILAQLQRTLIQRARINKRQAKPHTFQRLLALSQADRLLA